MCRPERRESAGGRGWVEGDGWKEWVQPERTGGSGRPPNYSLPRKVGGDVPDEDRGVCDRGGTQRSCGWTTGSVVT